MSDRYTSSIFVVETGLQQRTHYCSLRLPPFLLSPLAHEARGGPNLPINPPYLPMAATITHPSSTKSSQLFERFEYVLRTIRRSTNIFDEKSMAIFITGIGGGCLPQAIGKRIRLSCQACLSKRI